MASGEHESRWFPSFVIIPSLKPDLKPETIQTLAYIQVNASLIVVDAHTA